MVVHNPVEFEAEAASQSSGGGSEILEHARHHDGRGLDFEEEERAGIWAPQEEDLRPLLSVG